MRNGPSFSLKIIKYASLEENSISAWGGGKEGVFFLFYGPNPGLEEKGLKVRP